MRIKYHSFEIMRANPPDCSFCRWMRGKIKNNAIKKIWTRLPLYGVVHKSKVSWLHAGGCIFIGERASLKSNTMHQTHYPHKPSLCPQRASTFSQVGRVKIKYLDVPVKRCAHSDPDWARVWNDGTTTHFYYQMWNCNRNSRLLIPTLI